MYEELKEILLNNENKKSKENKEIKKEELVNLKNKMAKKHGVKKAPTDIEISLNIPGLKLKTKPMRTGSGVAVIATMTAPFACPHGKCTYCPGGPNSAFGTVPQSYTGKEPSTMRAIRNKYDSYLIVINRLEQYIVMQHFPDKVEQIIMGGTFLSFPEVYREGYVKYSFKAMNDFGDLFYDENGNIDIELFKKFFMLPGDINNAERRKKLQEKISDMKERIVGRENVNGTSYIFVGKKTGVKLEDEKKRNEKAKIKCVAQCIETKPDICFEEHINDALNYGCTRIELGVQTTYPEILNALNRGQTHEDTLKSIQLMKDSFLKVGFHMMPGLPGTNREMDIENFRRLFDDEEWQPDALKIYPCMVFPGTKLWDDWKFGKFKPIEAEEAAEIIAEAKKYVPHYCRIMRVQRDIPSFQVDAGVKKTNLRQDVDNLLLKKKIVCRCIRCREPKTGDTARKIDYSSVKINVMKYKSSGGTEYFISADDMKNDTLIGFCRLRVPYKPFRPEITPGSVGIRELHVYGTAVPIGIGEENNESAQHRGWGKKLLMEAERIAKNEICAKKILVISGVGVKEYYRKLGYKDDGVYVSKKIV